MYKDLFPIKNSDLSVDYNFWKASCCLTTDQLYVLYFLQACMHIWADGYPSEYTEALKTASIISRGTMAVQS